MPGLVDQSRDYPVPPERLWASVTDLDDLAAVCRGFLQFDGLPGGRVRPGQVIDLRCRVFGLPPALRWQMRIAELDPAAMRVASVERGTGVARWHHVIQVSAIPKGARLRDRVEIEAGWRTPLVTLWARALYRHRHRARLRLFGLN